MSGKEFLDMAKHLLVFTAVITGIIAVRFLIYMPEGLKERISQGLPF